MSLPADDNAIDAAIAATRALLDALEARRLDECEALLAPDVEITVPGGSVVRSIRQLAANSTRRYTHVGKHYERFEGMRSADGGITVYCIGTLHGRWLDGTPFDGIRYIDRFEFVDGKIRRQHVWNDTAYYQIAHGIAPPPPPPPGAA